MNPEISFKDIKVFRNSLTDMIQTHIYHIDKIQFQRRINSDKKLLGTNCKNKKIASSATLGDLLYFIIRRLILESGEIYVRFSSEIGLRQSRECNKEG